MSSLPKQLSTRKLLRFLRQSNSNGAMEESKSSHTVATQNDLELSDPNFTCSQETDDFNDHNSNSSTSACPSVVRSSSLTPPLSSSMPASSSSAACIHQRRKFATPEQAIAAFELIERSFDERKQTQMPQRPSRGTFDDCYVARSSSIAATAVPAAQPKVDVLPRKPQRSDASPRMPSRQFNDDFWGGSKSESFVVDGRTAQELY
jgi:hypothetical protein